MILVKLRQTNVSIYEIKSMKVLGTNEQQFQRLMILIYDNCEHQHRMTICPFKNNW